MTREQTLITKWGAILGIVVALTALISAMARAGDDRFVNKVDYQKDLGEMRGDIKVIRAAVCRSTPEACQ